jgi:hypothetical protein
MGGLAVALRRADPERLLHAPLYDSAMFVSWWWFRPALLRRPPGGQILPQLRLFYSSILEHATLAQIQAHSRRLR